MKQLLKSRFVYLIRLFRVVCIGKYAQFTKKHLLFVNVHSCSTVKVKQQ